MKAARFDMFSRADGAPPRKLGAFMLWGLKGIWPVLILAGVLSAIAGTIEVFAAVVLGRVIDAAVDAERATFFADHAVLLLAAAAFFVLVRPISVGISSAANNLLVGPNVMPLVLTRVFRWTLGQDVTFFDNDFAGRIATKQMQTARAITDIATDFINTVAFALASVIASAVVLVAIDIWMAVALIVWLVLYLGFIRIFLPRIRKQASARAAARAMITGQVVDTITNIKTVKLFAHAEFEDRTALQAMKTYRDKAYDFGVASTRFRFWLMTLAGTLPVILIGGTLLFWSQGAATAGEIAAAGAISIRIAQMTGWVSMSLMGLYANVGEAEDGMRTLTPPHKLIDAPDAKPLVLTRGEVVFDDVTFTYGKGTGAVEHVRLAVRPGEKIGIVGASGAGKSTLMSLLLRLYDPEKGRVLIDGQDIAHVTQESLRRQIGMVTQETAMFNRSARDNILYGRTDATEDEVVEAARQAEADTFIRDMIDQRGRKGYDAHLGERGVKLSGGQRQRIALARAFLKNAPILILDEATSALDSEVEASIQEALERVMVGKTVLAIAHRLSTIAAMDRIIVLDQGHIAEEGTHADLLARDGLYARYWNRQSGGFIGVDEDLKGAAE